MLALALLLAQAAAPAPPPACSGLAVLLGLDADRTDAPLGDAKITDVRRAADTIILVRSCKGVVRALWIPRGTALHLPGGRPVEAGRALQQGGIARLDAALAATLGARPDAHALLDLRGFGALVDAVGGVAWPGGGAQGLPRCARRIDGREITRYVRARPGDTASDLRRIRRQMLLVQAFADGLPRTGVARIARAAVALPKVGKTDLGVVSSAQMTLRIAREPMRCATLPGQVGGRDYRLAPGARTFARRFLGISARKANGGRRTAAGFGGEFKATAQCLGKRLRDG